MRKKNLQSFDDITEVMSNPKAILFEMVLQMSLVKLDRLNGGDTEDEVRWKIGYM